MQRGRGRGDARRGPGLTHDVAAVLAAGGLGRRAGSDTLKQFRSLAGRPLLMWSLDVLRAAGCAPVVIVVPEDALSRGEELTKDLPDVEVAPGGDTRRASVASGLRSVGSGRVVVHDAARPLVRRDAVEAVVDALDDADGALVAMPVDETLKSVVDERVVGTVDRSTLWRAQTPQAFRTEVLRYAHECAARDGFDATDDAQLLERYGGAVRVVAGRAGNLKITYQEDFAVAQAMLEGRA